MRSGIVRAIKKYNHVRVANAVHSAGYRWKNPFRRPHNIEKMLERLPRHDLVYILKNLQTEPLVSNYFSPLAKTRGIVDKIIRKILLK